MIEKGGDPPFGSVPHHPAATKSKICYFEAARMPGLDDLHCQHYMTNAGTDLVPTLAATDHNKRESYFTFRLSSQHAGTVWRWTDINSVHARIVTS